MNYSQYSNGNPPPGTPFQTGHGYPEGGHSWPQGGEAGVPNQQHQDAQPSPGAGQPYGYGQAADGYNYGQATGGYNYGQAADGYHYGQASDPYALHPLSGTLSQGQPADAYGHIQQNYGHGLCPPVGGYDAAHQQATVASGYGPYAGAHYGAAEPAHLPDYGRPDMGANDPGHAQALQSYAPAAGHSAGATAGAHGRPHGVAGRPAEMPVFSPWAAQNTPGLHAVGTAPTDIASQLAVLGMADRLPKMAGAKGAGLGLGGAIVPTIGRNLQIGEMYEGTVAGLQGMYWVRYESKIGVAAAGAVGFGFASAGVGVSLSAAYAKTTVLHMLVPLQAARAIAADQKNTKGRYLEAFHLRDAGMRTPDFTQPETLQLGDTRSTTSDMSGCFGIVVSTTGQRAGAYCSVDGQFTMHVSKADDCTMLLAFSPVKTVKVGMMVGGMLDQADISRSHATATRFVVACNIYDPRGRATYDQAVRAGKPPQFGVDPATALTHKDTLADTFAPCFAASGVQLLEVEVVDQVIKRGGAGLLTSSAMQKIERFFPVATGLSMASISDNRTRVVDGVTTYTANTQATERQVAMGHLGNRTSLVYVNAMYRQTSAHGPMQFVGLNLGVQYRLAASGPMFSNGMVKELNKHFRLGLPEFDKTKARRDYQIRITQALTFDDIRRLTQPIDGNTGAAESKHVQALIAQLKELEAQANSEMGYEALGTHLGAYDPGALAELVGEDTSLEAAKALQDGIRDVETMAAIFRRADPSGANMKLHISSDSYEKPLIEVRDLDLRYGDSPISHTDRIADVTKRFEDVAKARDKILGAFDLLETDGVMKMLKPEERDEFEIRLAFAYSTLTDIISFEEDRGRGRVKANTTPLQQLAIARQEKIFKAMTPAMQAKVLGLIQSMGRTIKDPAKVVHAVQKALAEERTKLHKYRLPSAIKAEAFGRIKEAELVLTTIDHRATQRDISKAVATEVKSFTELFGFVPQLYATPASYGQQNQTAWDASPTMQSWGATPWQQSGGGDDAGLTAQMYQMTISPVSPQPYYGSPSHQQGGGYGSAPMGTYTGAAYGLSGPSSAVTYPPIVAPSNLDPEIDAALEIIRQGYELHILIQDDSTMKRYKPELERLLHRTLELVVNDTHQTFTVSRISDVLQNRPTCRYTKNEIPGLKYAVLDDMLTEGSNIMGGAALEQLTFTYLKECAADMHNTRGAAFVYFGTGDLDDADTLVNAFKETKTELGPKMADRICLGIVQIGTSTGGQLATQSLDRRSDVGNMIETLLGAEGKTRWDLAQLLLGMVDSTIDKKNDRANLFDASKNIFKIDRDNANRRIADAQGTLERKKTVLNNKASELRRKFSRKRTDAG
jgi:hypothetical protein